MKPRRILIFSFAYYPNLVGGAEVAVKEITDRISPDVVAFDLIAMKDKADLASVERMGNVTVHRVGTSKISYMWKAVRTALKLHREQPYDVVWSLMVTYSSFAAVVFKMMKPRVPFLFTLQDGDPIPYIKRKALPLYPLFKMMFTRAHHIQAISTYLADWAREMGATCPVSVIPNAVDVELFSTHKTAHDENMLKELLGKKEGDVFLVTTSRLVTKNALHDVIDALTYLPAQVKFVVLGQGQELPNLQAQISKLKLEDRVRMLGYVAHKNMPAYLHLSDIFIRPSVSEGLGNSFIEAMAARIPVIGTAVGGIPDFLIDGETGYVCEVHNPRSIAQKVEKIMKDKQSVDYVVNNAYDMVIKKYQWKNIVEKMQDIFLSI